MVRSHEPSRSRLSRRAAVVGLGVSLASQTLAAGQGATPTAPRDRTQQRQSIDGYRHCSSTMGDQDLWRWTCRRR
jgi:hypothetical protein